MRLVEILIVAALLLLIIGGVVSWQNGLFAQNRQINLALAKESEARAVFRDLINGLRSARSAATGAYPLALTASTTLVFYSDLDHNGLVERYRYFLTGTTLKRGKLNPSGNPPSYNELDEQVVEMVHSLTNSISSSPVPLFNYYDNHSPLTDPPLIEPVAPNTVRLVRIIMLIGGNRYESQATIRSVRDNL